MLQSLAWKVNRRKSRNLYLKRSQKTEAAGKSANWECSGHVLRASADTLNSADCHDVSFIRHPAHLSY
ncbi:hypothetical protein RRG08_016163 [Elysia crispata]|uniref:Uncharacterized protein n=1 Tax=Elysia crispata TaxID=231223 RepID=A0AAE1D8Z9_9GAST|nr:hypothetical protein RRG08_016163 [Elysia crispata]